MTSPRRRLVRRPPASRPDGDVRRQRRLAKLRPQLDRERAAPERWQKRLRRAFRAIEKHQARVTRAERQLARLQE
jgi:hypothetical protein